MHEPNINIVQEIEGYCNDAGIPQDTAKPADPDDSNDEDDGLLVLFLGN